MTLALPFLPVTIQLTQSHLVVLQVLPIKACPNPPGVLTKVCLLLQVILITDCRTFLVDLIKGYHGLQVILTKDCRRALA